jgi:hypothetical protein
VCKGDVAHVMTSSSVNQQKMKKPDISRRKKMFVTCDDVKPRVSWQYKHRFQGMKRKKSAIERNDDCLHRIMVDKVYEESDESNFGKYYRSEKALGLHRARIRYWFIKFHDPENFHPGDHGGRKNQGTFKTWEFPFVVESVCLFFKENPEASLTEVCEDLSYIFDRRVTKPVASRFLRHVMKWSWRIPTQFQIQKYSEANIEYYINFIDWIQQIDYSRLKFMDESHIVAKQLDKKKICGMINNRSYTKRNNLNEPHGSLSLLVGLGEHDPIFFDYREDSNDQFDFLSFAIDALTAGALVEGDFFIVDNAAIHSGREMLPTLKDL